MQSFRKPSSHLSGFSVAGVGLVAIAIVAAVLVVGSHRGAAAEKATDAGRAPVPSATAPIGPSYFGIHFHRLAQSPPESAVTTWPPAPMVFGTVRVWDSHTRWADIAPARGQWNFERLDRYVSIARSHQAKVLYVLGSTPSWASSRPKEQCPYGYDGCAAGPTDLALWEEYVRKVVQRYRGQIDAYELWNEPFFSEINPKKNPDDFYYGPVAEMVEMARIARKVLDELDPGCVLSTPGFTGRVEFLDLFLKSGGKQYVQAISYHFYSSSSTQLAATIADVREVMHRNQVDALPLWNSEAGFFAYKDGALPAPDLLLEARRQSAASMAQSLIVSAAAGIDRYYFYAWDNELSGMIDRLGRTLAPSGAMQKTQAWLIGASLDGCRAFGNQGTVCSGTKDGQQFEIVWAEQRSVQKFPVPAGWRVATIERLFDADAVAMTANPAGRVIEPAPMRLHLLPI